MKKLRLEVDGLAVESFATGAPREGRGTVLPNALACTVDASCACPTSPLECGTFAPTEHSCAYTLPEVCTGWSDVATCWDCN
jgi:hypothetical protein